VHACDKLILAFFFPTPAIHRYLQPQCLSDKYFLNNLSCRVGEI
jgi:hypothetical protein